VQELVPEHLQQLMAVGVSVSRAAFLAVQFRRIALRTSRIRLRARLWEK